jgi:hypothetical protein
VLGFTWYSLIDQVDWDSSLRTDRGRVNPRGLYDLHRKPRAVGRAFRQLVADWKPVLAEQSAVVTLPVSAPAAGDAAVNPAAARIAATSRSDTELPATLLNRPRSGVTRRPRR